METRYNFRIVNSSDFTSEKEFEEVLNRYGKEGYHVVAVGHGFNISAVIMEKETLVEEE